MSWNMDLVGYSITKEYRHEAGGPLNHITPSRKQSVMLVAGPQSLTTLELKLQGGDMPSFSFKRRNIMPRSGSGGRHGFTGSCTGVCFEPESTAVAASCTNMGHIHLWDTGWPSKSIFDWPAHHRAVNAIAWLPAARGAGGHSQGLVSADQGYLKLWKPNSELLERGESDNPEMEADDHWTTGGPGTANAIRAIPGQQAQDSGSKEFLPCWQKRCGDAVRDLHASSRDGGTCQILVCSGTSAWVLKLSACAANDVKVKDDMNHLVSIKPAISGRLHPHLPDIFAVVAQDSVVRIFDSRMMKRENDCCNLRTGSSIGCVRWRPDRPEQLATASGSPLNTMGGSLLVWDLRRPYCPLHEFSDSHSVSDFFWADTNHLISCGKDSTVRLHSVGNSYQPLQRVCVTSATWAFNKDGEEMLGAITDVPDRVAEPSMDLEAHWRELAELVQWQRGFESDVDLSPKSMNLAQELRNCSAGVRTCNFFASPNGQLDAGYGVVELMQVASRASTDTTSQSASSLCVIEAERCKAQGAEGRALTWRLLAQVLGDEPPDELLASILAGPAEVPEASMPVSGNFRDNLEDSFVFREKVAVSNLKRWRQAWRTETLSHIVAMHEERNDLGMLLSLVAVLGLGREPELRVRKKVLRWTQAAAEVLSRVQAFVSRAALLRTSPLSEVHELGQTNTSLSFRCAYCPQPFEPTRGLIVNLRHGTKSLSGKATRQGAKRTMQGRTLPVCPNCQRRRTPPCAVCGEDVRGLWVSCQVCLHVATSDTSENGSSKATDVVLQEDAITSVFRI